jgi:hypothetical protein
VAEVELPNPEELRERAEDRFGRRVALVTAVYAVILAVASLGGNNGFTLFARVPFLEPSVH